MKMLKKSIILITVILLMTGCGNKNNTSKKLASGNSVDEIINNQINTTQANETQTSEADNVSKIDNTIKAGDSQTNDVDYDLTTMSSDMVYAIVYQIMVNPEQYEGKTFRIDGNFYATYYQPTQKYYYYCVIKDATACCSQGLEFVWEDGSHIYPDEYPSKGTDVIVEGTLETYKEDGDNNMYCRLINSSLYT